MACSFEIYTSTVGPRNLLYITNDNLIIFIDLLATLSKYVHNLLLHRVRFSCCASGDAGFYFEIESYVSLQSCSIRTFFMANIKSEERERETERPPSAEGKASV